MLNFGKCDRNVENRGDEEGDPTVMTGINARGRQQSRYAKPGPIENLKQLKKQVTVSLFTGQYVKQTLPGQGQQADVEQQLTDVQKLNHEDVLDRPDRRESCCHVSIMVVVLTLSLLEGFVWGNGDIF